MTLRKAESEKQGKIAQKCREYNPVRGAMYRGAGLSLQCFSDILYGAPSKGGGGEEAREETAHNPFPTETSSRSEEPLALVEAVECKGHASRGPVIQTPESLFYDLGLNINTCVFVCECVL